MLSLFCKTCGTVADFFVEQENINGHGYSCLRCSQCTEFRQYKCGICERTYSCKRGDRKHIEKHMKEVHPDNYTSVNFGSTDDEEEETKERVNDSDSDDEFVDCEEGSWGGNDNIDFDVAAASLSNSFSHVNIERDARLAPKFENETSDIYYKQEWELYHEGGNALFGGIRGVCWRSRYQLELTGIEEVVDLDDARLMFNI